MTAMDQEAVELVEQAADALNRAELILRRNEKFSREAVGRAHLDTVVASHIIRRELYDEVMVASGLT